MVLLPGYPHRKLEHGVLCTVLESQVQPGSRVGCSKGRISWPFRLKKVVNLGDLRYTWTPFVTFKIKTLVTESQNHRMFGVGRDLCGSSSPTP